MAFSIGEMSSIFTGIKIKHVYFWQYFACLRDTWWPSWSSWLRQGRNTH